MDVAGLVAGSGWASGVNLYAVVALLGWLGRIGFADVPEALEHPAVIAIAGGMYAVEFLADKVPFLDNAWDAIHTLVRPLGAAALAVVLVDDAALTTELLAGAGSGGLALASHSAKATTRAAINTSPEPVSNIVVSLAEDGLVAAVVVLAVRYPWATLAVVGVLTIAAGWIVVALWSRARKLLVRLRERRRTSRISGGPLRR